MEGVVRAEGHKPGCSPSKLVINLKPQKRSLKLPLLLLERAAEVIG
jgi:hypothetical protein